ncbi:MAG TPA: site-specific integrase [Acidimicrobiales bacterium]|nr:site-specific integrase [Acidimicrobiales bacterium]
MLLDAMPERYRVAGVLAAGAGLRQGEALGVTVDRIDFLRRRLVIDRQMVTPPTGTPGLAPPKSDASYRKVPLADPVLEALADHLRRFPPGDDGLVLTYGDGRPVRRNRFGYMWRQSCARAGLDFRYHDLRHHFASLLIAGGESVVAIQRVLGHASAKVTLDTYGHLFPDAEDHTRAVLNAALSGWCVQDVSKGTHQGGESAGQPT